MAPFNQRQIGYIQAIAGRQQHVTLTCGQHDGQINSEDNFNASAQGWRIPQVFGSTTLPAGDFPDVLGVVTGTNSTDGHGNSKSLLLQNWNLDQYWELGFDSRAHHTNDKLEPEDFTNLWTTAIGSGATHNLNVFNAPVKGLLENDAGTHTADANGELVRNPRYIESIHRATADGFLNSTNLKFRFTLPTEMTLNGSNPMGQDHYEFRWIVWRHKRPTAPGQTATDNIADSNMDMIRDGCSFRNHGYDFFMGQTGRKRGLLGYTFNKNLDADKDTTGQNTEQYSGYYWNDDATPSAFEFGAAPNNVEKPDGEKGMTVDDIMTCRINKDDYVVMKDVRFFLGKEHGKSHFEDTLHWDWNDPIDTIKDNVLTSPTLNNKNYRWHMTLFGTSGGKKPVILNHSVRWTTKMESG